MELLYIVLGILGTLAASVIGRAKYVKVKKVLTEAYELATAINDGLRDEGISAAEAAEIKKQLDEMIDAIWAVFGKGLEIEVELED